MSVKGGGANPCPLRDISFFKGKKCLESLKRKIIFVLWRKKLTFLLINPLRPGRGELKAYAEMSVKNVRFILTAPLSSPNPFVSLTSLHCSLSRVSLTLSCAMNLKLYPMDRQRCPMQIASCKYFIYFSHEIVVSVPSSLYILQ